MDDILFLLLCCTFVRVQVPEFVACGRSDHDLNNAGKQMSRLSARIITEEK